MAPGACFLTLALFKNKILHSITQHCLLAAKTNFSCELQFCIDVPFLLQVVDMRFSLFCHALLLILLLFSIVLAVEKDLLLCKLKYSASAHRRVLLRLHWHCVLRTPGSAALCEST